MKHLSLVYLLICAACEFGAFSRAYGHGFAGARFFPATLSTDDPFVADEFSLIQGVSNTLNGIIANKDAIR